jgi:hypothetical protein
MAPMGSLHGFEIDCDRELRRLSPTPGSLGMVQVRSTARSPLEESCELLHLIADAEGPPVHATGRSHDRLVSWHADGGSFLIDASTGRIAYRAEDASAASGPARWEDRLGSTALPLLAGERGGLPLHASAVGVEGRAVVICGVTGRGKSTLAAALAARGHEQIAEDGVVVRFNDHEPLVWPGLSGALITGEAGTAIGIGTAGPESGPTDPRGRIFVETPRRVTGPTPAAGVAILMERAGDRVEMVNPQPAKAHRELLAHVLGGRRGPAAFASAARLVERVPITMLIVPDSVEKLKEAAEVLESLPGLD